MKTPHAALGLAASVSLAILSWALSHPYQGIFHDASLYTLQALAYLHPASLQQDVFLRLGSQDNFTIFSPLYAAAIDRLGAENAAAVLTLCLQCALFAGAWTLARTVLSASMALLGVCVLVAVPGDYGPGQVFTCVESFITPRMAAEALVLTGLAAALNSRRTLALTLVTIAALFHPIMAAAGVAALIHFFVAVPRPKLMWALVIAGIAALALAAIAMPDGIFGRFDNTWWVLVKTRSPYLFVAHWTAQDWARAAVTLATLIAGTAAANGADVRRLCRMLLTTSVAGVALTVIAGDLLHLVLFTQLQPWRWLWLATAVSALVLPEILRVNWSCGAAGRTTSILLASAWIFGSNAYALAAAALAAVAVATAVNDRLKPDAVRLVFWGACGLLVIAGAWRIATNLEFTEAHYLDPRIPMWMRRSMSFFHDGSVPLAMLILVGWLMRNPRAVLGLVVMLCLNTAGLALILPQAWGQWTMQDFSPEHVAQFARWRTRIAPGVDVFWPESPLGVWLLLERPSFISVVQTSGMVFSRRTAVELEHRAEELSSVISPQTFMGWNSGGSAVVLSVPQLKLACRTGAFEFLVTAADIGITPLERVYRAAEASHRALRLYRCRA